MSFIQRVKFVVPKSTKMPVLVVLVKRLNIRKDESAVTVVNREQFGEIATSHGFDSSWRACEGDPVSAILNRERISGVFANNNSWWGTHINCDP